jgi:hypothetical protein
MTLTPLEDKAAAGDVHAQIALAERLDAEGRHEDALNWLAKAAQTGDAEALTRVGKRLITGENAPAMPAQGGGLLTDAVKAGGGEAAAILSVLAAVGLYRPQSWPEALDLLQRAAELGWAPAQAQLRILASEAGRSAGEDWAGLRRTIDLDAWLHPAQPTRTLSETPRLQVFERFMPPQVCDWVTAQARDRLVRAEIYGASQSRSLKDPSRTNTTANFTLVETNLINLLIQAKIGASVGASQAKMEAFNVLHYDVGEQFVDHFDFLDPAVPAYAAEIAQVGQRAATFLLYLNDDYEGGETAFPKLGLSYRGDTGDGFFFTNVHEDTGMPDVRSAHAGRTPTAGQKWVLTQFIRSRPGIGPGSSVA